MIFDLAYKNNYKEVVKLDAISKAIDQLSTELNVDYTHLISTAYCGEDLEGVISTTIQMISQKGVQ